MKEEEEDLYNCIIVQEILDGETGAFEVTGCINLSLIGLDGRYLWWICKRLGWIAKWVVCGERETHRSVKVLRFTKVLSHSDLTDWLGIYTHTHKRFLCVFVGCCIDLSLSLWHVNNLVSLAIPDWLLHSSQPQKKLSTRKFEGLFLL